MRRAEDGATAGLAALAEAPTVERALDAVREFLGMEVAFIGQVTPEREILRTVRGDAASFGFFEGMQIPRSAIARTADTGASVSVPLRFSDGFVYGLLCAASQSRRPGLRSRELELLNVFARIVCDLLEREELHRAMRTAELQDAAVKLLLAAVDARDAYTSAHSRAVVMHAVAVAEHLGLDADEAADVRHVAMLHDVGKLAIPESILLKPAALTEDEWNVMQTHSTAGEKLLGQVPSLRHLCPAVRAEHEHWDGNGYPDGLEGTQIPLASRITLVCDSFDAMTSARPYREALSVVAAAEHVTVGIGTQFCPTAAAALLSIVQPACAGEPSQPVGRVPPAFHRGRCRCARCGFHTLADIGCRVAGQCPNCLSYDLAEVKPGE